MGYKQMAFFVGGVLALLSGAVQTAHAQDIWATGFQKAVTPIMAQITDLHNFLFVIITVITLFVLGLLIVVIVRFNHRANPTPSTTSHNTLIEVIWTGIPIIILAVIAVPSLKLLYVADRAPDAEMTIKAIGQQWYWSYEYPDHGDFTFDAYMVPEDELKPGQPRLLTADNALVVPVKTTVRLLVTAGDVIHSFAVPAFGVKMDGVPGRINETWFEVTETGTYYGQCSEICGTGHSFMPIEVRVVTRPEFENWVKQAREDFARLDPEPALQVVSLRVQHDLAAR